MKLYIENLKIKNKKIFEELVSKYLFNKQHSIEIYSDSGIFKIENNKIYKIDFIDNEVIEMKDYVLGKKLFFDRTIVKKRQEYISCIPNNNITINKYIYRLQLRPKSPFNCIIEYNIDNDCIYDIYFQLHEKHAAYSDADLDNEFMKEDLISFITEMN